MMLILASNSPRRQQLLSLGEWSFTVSPAEVDERPLPGEDPKDYVLRMAESKARAAASKVQSGGLIVAADTTVVKRDSAGEVILGKPANPQEAETMLRSLRGRTHQVYTGLAVLRIDDGKVLTDCCITDVPMRNYSDEEMRAYIASGDPLDKAGAYAIQHPVFKPVENLEGCYANVVGLPLCHLTRTLRRMGIHPGIDISTACQSTLQYQCPIYQQVFHGEL